jgi:hypothetical protein
MKMFFLLYSLFFIAACGQSGGWQTGKAIDLDKESSVSVFDFVDSVEVVQLETNDQCLIGTISEVLLFKEKYFIHDVQQQTVFCFDQSGKFIRKIGERGHGSEEHAHLGSIAIDPYNEQLLLVVPFGSVLCFDLNGNFLTRVEVPDAGAINELHVLNADKWMFASLNNHGILYFSKEESRIIERLYENRTRLPALPHPLEQSYTYNDSVFYLPTFDATTLNMSDVHRKTAYTWNLGVNNNSRRQIESFLKNVESVQIRSREDYISYLEMLNNSLNHFIHFTRESHRYRMSVLDYKNEFLHLVFDKLENKAVVFRKTKEGIHWVYSGFLNHQDRVIVYDTATHPSRKDITSYTKEIFSPEQLKIVEAHTENDNPFLVVYHLKK